MKVTWCENIGTMGLKDMGIFSGPSSRRDELVTIGI